MLVRAIVNTAEKIGKLNEVVNCRGVGNNTPLLTTIEANCESLSDLLIEKGKPINFILLGSLKFTGASMLDSDESGVSPLHAAASIGSLSLLEKLLKNGILAHSEENFSFFQKYQLISKMKKDAHLYTMRVIKGNLPRFNFF